MEQFLSLLFVSMVAGIPPSSFEERDDTEFGYYYGEFLTYAMPDDDPMAQLIIRRLAESLFTQADSKVFQQRLSALKMLSQKNPELQPRVALLNTMLNKSLTQRISKSKRRRYLFAAGGAVVGALIALPIGKVIASHSALGQKALWIAVPMGALTGSGAGYLLGELLIQHEMNEFNLSSKDLDFMRLELSH